MSLSPCTAICAATSWAAAIAAASSEIDISFLLLLVSTTAGWRTTPTAEGSVHDDAGASHRRTQWSWDHHALRQPRASRFPHARARFSNQQRQHGCSCCNAVHTGETIIMADVPLPGRDSIEAQREMFRIAANEYGLTINVIAARSPIKST